MIAVRDSGYTLHCTGCGAGIELSQAERNDPFRAVEMREKMQSAHRECDAYGDPVAAKRALKQKRDDAMKKAKGEIVHGG